MHIRAYAVSLTAQPYIFVYHGVGMVCFGQQRKELRTYHRNAAEGKSLLCPSNEAFLCVKLQQPLRLPAAHAQRHQVSFLHMLPLHILQVHLRQYVHVVHQHVLPAREQRRSLLQSPAGVQQHLPLVANLYRCLPPVALDEVDNLVGEVVHVHNYMSYTCGLERVDSVFQQCHAINFDQRLRPVVRQRPQPRPQSSSKNKSFHSQLLVFR